MGDTQAQEKKSKGAPKGNASRFQHGAYSLLAMRTRGRPNGNTKLGRAFKAREQEYLQDMGGEENTSLSQRQIANDNTWCDFILATIDLQLQRRRRFTKNGKPLPLIDLRMRVAAHRRENYKLSGIKRVAKTLSIYEQLAKPDDDTPAAAANSQDGKID
jgi:hypothetical protein